MKYIKLFYIMLITAIFSSAQSAQRVQNPAVVPYSDAYNVTMLDGSGYFKPVNKDSFNRNTQAVKSVNGKTGNVVVNKSDVGLGNVDNTSDAAKPISTATQTALNGKYNIPSGTSGQYLNGLGNPVTFPTIPTNTNELTNGAGFITSAALSGYATTSTLTSGLSTKYNTPSGTTSQYVRGDGSLATFPTIPAQFNPIAGTNVSISGSYPNITFNAAATSVAFRNKAGSLSTSPVFFTDTFSVATATPTIDLSSYITAAGKTQCKVISAVGYRVGATTGTSPNVTITGITSTGVSLIFNQTNTATVSILGINVLSGLPTILVPDPTNIKVVIGAYFY